MYGVGEDRKGKKNLKREPGERGRRVMQTCAVHMMRHKRSSIKAVATGWRRVSSGGEADFLLLAFQIGARCVLGAG